MSQRLETKFYKLEKLVKWEHCEEVNNMLLADISPPQVCKWCIARGFSISQSKMYEYREMVRRCKRDNIPIEHVLGIAKPVSSLEGAEQVTKSVKSDLDVLDAVIQKGLNAMLDSPVIRFQDAIKAMELKRKIQTSNIMMSAQQIDQIREVEEAKFEAVIRVVTKYLTPEQLIELEEEIATAERDYYESNAPQLLEEYDKVNKTKPTNT